MLPQKTTSQIAFGVVTRTYWYSDDPEPDWRHVVSVDWKRTDVPRTAVKQDLLNSLGSALTICTITRNDGNWRLHQLLETGCDPGARSPESRRKPSASTAADNDSIEPDEQESEESDLDLERVGKDLSLIHISEPTRPY